MGAMDKLLGLFKIDAGEEDEAYDYDAEDDGFVENPQEKLRVPVKEPVVKETSRVDVQDDNKVRPFERKVVQPTQAKKRINDMNDISVRVFKPKAFDEAREIAETLIERKIVVMNFEGIDLSVSQRVLDIVTGVCIAIDGRLQKMSNYIFIAAPGNVDLSGEFQDIIDLYN